MKYKVSELDGALLVRAVGIAAGEFGPGIRRPVPKAYTSDWSEGGRIIERERIDVYFAATVKDEWVANPPSGAFQMAGPTPLIAAMRAFVASKLGEEVDL